MPNKIDLPFDEIKLVKELNHRNSAYLQNIKEVFIHAKPILNSGIPKVFTQYTLHDIGHSIRIMEYMYEFITDIKSISELEITILIYSALLHDIGMAVSDEEINEIKSDRYRSSDIKFSTLLHLRENNEEVALQDFIRRIHAKRSNDYILSKLFNFFQVPNQQLFNYGKFVGLICQSHNEDFDWIKSNLTNYEVLGEESFNPKFCSYLLRMSDLLDIDSQRTPLSLYKLINPKGISDKEWKQHFIVSNFKKIEFDDKTNKKLISFYGESTSAIIHRKFLSYVEWINIELKNAVQETMKMQEKYHLNFKENVQLKIKTIGYVFSADRLNIDFKAISALLMGEKIYGDKTLGLRELVQNCLDACIVRKEQEDKQTDFGDNIYTPIIKIILDQEKDIVVVKDNGTGMSHEILKKYFLNVGVSYYSSDDFLLQGLTYKPIGNFGIGFLSCFMISDVVKINTRYYLNSIKYSLELEKGSEFITINEEEDLKFEGTEIILNFKSFLDLFKNSITNIENFLKKYFLTEDVTIEVINKSQKKISEIENKIPREVKAPNTGIFRIRLEQYLKDVEGFIDIKLTNNYISKLKDISYSGTPLFYDGENLLEMDDESFNVKDLFINNEIHYIEIPIINGTIRKDYDKYFEVFEDIGDTIKKIKDRVENWITIFSTHDSMVKLGGMEITTDDEILPHFDYSMLEDYDHDLDYPTEIFKTELKVFKSDASTYILICAGGREDDLTYAWFFDDDFSINPVYLRNVLVSNYHLHLGFRASVFDIESYKINIKNREIYSDISRNDLSKEVRNEFGYAVNKIIHLDILKHAKLDSSKKKILKDFIANNFEQKSTIILE